MTGEARDEWAIIQDFLHERIDRAEYNRQIAEFWANHEQARPAAVASAPATREQELDRFRSRSRSHAAAVDRTGGRCFYCDDPDASHLEHKVPRSRGGATSPENCVLSCRSCNAKKATKTTDEFRIHLMLSEGRPPVAFPGEERPVVDRDWLLVSSPKIKPDYAPYQERLAGFVGSAAAS